MSILEFKLADTSSYLATLSIQRVSPTASSASSACSSPSISLPTSPADAVTGFYWHPNTPSVSEDCHGKELEAVAQILVGLKTESATSLGDLRRVKSIPDNLNERSSFGSDGEVNFMDEDFTDTDFNSKLGADEQDGWRSPSRSSTNGLKRSPSNSCLRHRRWQKPCPEDCNHKRRSSDIYDNEEITALDGDEQEQVQDSSDESFGQSYTDFLKSFEENRVKKVSEDTGSVVEATKQKRKFHGTSVATVACEYHTQLHARCPPNCIERRPAKPHPRSKKSKVLFDESKEEMISASSSSASAPSSPALSMPSDLMSDTEAPRLIPGPLLLDDDEDYEESDSKLTPFKRLSPGKRVRPSKKASCPRGAGRTGRKYLPQACDRHKLLHAKCPANCPDRIARDKLYASQQLQESTLYDGSDR